MICDEDFPSPASSLLIVYYIQPEDFRDPQILRLFSNVIKDFSPWFFFFLVCYFAPLILSSCFQESKFQNLFLLASSEKPNWLL